MDGRPIYSAEMDRHFVFRGSCGICGGPDARHRLIEALQDRHAGGDSIEELAEGYGLTVDAVRAAIGAREIGGES